MSYRHFRAADISVTPLSEKNISIYHTDNPYYLSLRVVDAIICKLLGCLNSTSFSSTIKFRVVEDTSGHSLQNNQ